MADGAAAGSAAPGADGGDDGEWRYVNTTHIIADITVEEVPSPEREAGGDGSTAAGAGDTAQVRVSRENSMQGTQWYCRPHATHKLLVQLTAGLSLKAIA